MTATAPAAAPAPRERPILFTGPMVRAILEGRKTQTRRPLKQFTDPGGAMLLHLEAGAATFGHSIPDDPVPVTVRCPYGAPGDRVWVREAFSLERLRVYPCPNAWYRADHAEDEVRAHPDLDVGECHDRGDCLHGIRWKPGIHLPRRLSRLLLEVTDVRVERVQAIPEADALAEGFAARRDESWTAYDPRTEGYPTFFAPPRCPPYETPRHHVREIPAAHEFECAWRRMYPGDFAWHLNPWVWVVSFRRVTT